MIDKINHPAHYDGIHIEVIELTEMYSFTIGNVIKYLCRAGKKEGATEHEDLSKAAWYLRRAIDGGSSLTPVVCDKSAITARATVELFTKANVYIKRLFDAYPLSDDRYGTVTRASLNSTLQLVEARLKEIEREAN